MRNKSTNYPVAIYSSTSPAKVIKNSGVTILVKFEIKMNRRQIRHHTTNQLIVTCPMDRPPLPTPFPTPAMPFLCHLPI